VLGSITDKRVVTMPHGIGEIVLGFKYAPILHDYKHEVGSALGFSISHSLALKRGMLLVNLNKWFCSHCAQDA
jgi:hypothetical protein